MAFPGISQLFAPRQQQAPAPAAAPAAPQQPNGQPGSSMQLQQPNAGAPQQATDQSGASPLDAYKDLWKTTNTDGQQADPFASPLFQTDPAKLREAVAKTDFTQGVPQDLMQKVMAGNDPQALIQLINHVAQQSLSLSVQLGSSLQEQAGQTIGKRVNQLLPDRFKEFQLNSQVPENPILSNPAVEPMLKMARAQMKMAYPDLSAAEINKRAEQYITDFAKSVAGGPGQSSADSSEQKSEMDWAQWVSPAGR